MPTLHKGGYMGEEKPGVFFYKEMIVINLKCGCKVVLNECPLMRDGTMHYICFDHASLPWGTEERANFIEASKKAIKRINEYLDPDLIDVSDHIKKDNCTNKE